MSGGYFDYKQHQIYMIIEEIKELIDNNNKKDQYGHSYDFPDDIIDEFKTAIKVLNKAYIYAHRIDYLVSGDDGQENFRKRLKEELKENYEKET